MEIGNLEEVVADDREPLPWSLRMKLAHDISEGMAYLHSVGVIHRDLASKVCVSQTLREFNCIPLFPPKEINMQTNTSVCHENQLVNFVRSFSLECADFKRKQWLHCSGCRLRSGS